MTPTSFTYPSHDGSPVAARRWNATATARAIRDDLPVHIALGEDDPVHGGQALLAPVVDRFRSRTPDVTVHVYPGARHEVFNETNRAEVVFDLLAWLNRVVPG